MFRRENGDRNSQRKEKEIYELKTTSRISNQWEMTNKLYILHPIGTNSGVKGKITQLARPEIKVHLDFRTELLILRSCQEIMRMQRKWVY